MGWTSTADPLENVARASLFFYTKEQAMDFWCVLSQGERAWDVVAHAWGNDCRGHEKGKRARRGGGTCDLQPLLLLAVS